MRRIGRRLALLAVLVAATGISSTTVAARGATAELKPPASGAWFGALVQKRSESSHYAAVLSFEKAIGRKLAIDHHYHAWDGVSLSEEAQDIAAGRIPLVSWPSGSWPAG